MFTQWLFSTLGLFVLLVFLAPKDGAGAALVMAGIVAAVLVGTGAL